MAAESETQMFTKVSADDAKFFGASVRAWIVMALIFTIAGCHVLITAGIVIDAILNKDWSKVGTFANVGEPLYSLSTLALGFYFGKATTK